MEKNPSRASGGIPFLGIIGLFATAALYMADLAFYPAFGTMLEAFPETPIEVMNFCMTGSQLSAMAASLAVIPLMGRFDKKLLLLVETAIFGVTAIAAPLVPNALFVTVMRTLSGFGFGGILGVAGALIQQVYADDKDRRDRLVGGYNAALGVAGALCSLAGGMLAAASWDHIFRIYWIAVPVFFLVLLFVPSAQPESDEADREAADVASSPDGWDGTLLSVALAALSYLYVNVIFVGMASGEVSVFLAELGLGGEAESGLLLMVGSIMALPCGILFPAIYHRFGRFTPALFYGVMVAGLVVYCLPVNLAAVTLGLACVAFAYSMGLSYYMVYAGEVAPPAKTATAITMVTIGMALGAFLSPCLVGTIQSILGVDTLAPVYPVLLAASCAGLALSVVLALRARRAVKTLV